MPEPIRLNAFEMNCGVHQSPGLWRHPRDRSRDDRRLEPWIDLARTLGGPTMPSLERTRRTLLAMGTALLAMTALGRGAAAAETVRIGVLPIVYADSVEAAVDEARVIK